VTAHRLTYGDDPSQFATLRLPDRPSPCEPVVLLHGGWWRDRHDLHLMDPLADDLLAAGHAVYNVEYRRTGSGGGWPQTRKDVTAALHRLARFAAEEPGAGLDLGRAAAVGHSAGGHLALLCAAEAGIDRVVGLAPVTDLRRSAEEGLGEDAVAPFLGPEPSEDAFTESSPVRLLPLGVRQLVVHGDADPRVPVDHSRDYVAAAREAGDPVEYHESPGADHFAVIDPVHPSWQEVRGWLSR
jgi:acetyl esterase/lipase